MKKAVVLLVLLTFILGISGCYPSRVIGTNENIEQLNTCCYYVEECYIKKMPTDNETLNLIIKSTNDFEKIFDDNYKDTNYNQMIRELKKLYKCSTREAINQAKLYTYYIRLNALLLLDDKDYEQELQNVYPRYISSKYSKYIYSLEPNVISLSEKQFSVVVNTYDKLLALYTSDIDQYVILIELRELYSMYETYNFPEKYINTINSILDKYDDDPAPYSRDLKKEFIKSIENYSVSKKTGDG